MNRIMTKDQEQSETYKKPYQKKNKIILPIIIIAVIFIGSILVANLFFSNQDGPDFKFEAGGYDSEIISFSPPIENASLKIFLTNNGTETAHNVIVEAEIKTADKRGVLIDEVPIGTLEQNETKQIDFVFINETGIPFRAFIEGKITITSEETKKTLESAG